MDAHDAPAGTLCWHIHHDVLLEAATEPLQERVDFIQRCKPTSEHERRLRLMKPVEGDLPEAVVEAAWEFYEAYVYSEKVELNAFLRAGQVASDARRKFKHAVVDHQAEVDALHEAECPDCPWDGETIFPDDAEREEVRP